MMIWGAGASPRAKLPAWLVMPPWNLKKIYQISAINKKSLKGTTKLLKYSLFLLFRTAPVETTTTIEKRSYHKINKISQIVYKNEIQKQIGIKIWI